ncbi:hypothetical protein ANCCEY_05703 [Ancylostoma ceylanicum]|uniref:Uncharacterized protein n=1 Tax=Ancylostoma ceylanicum TaxID=53326 RepID=A0A0D6LTI0_9BILA|nr:hypothetical protein ANCCEY_05703 [Ancylostoma ceylanicum]
MSQSDMREEERSFKVSGDAIASGEQLRLAPSMRSRKGIVWNKRPMQESENFQVSGDAIASGEQLRLAPSMRSRKGIVWNKRPMQESENFQTYHITMSTTRTMSRTPQL